MKVATILNQLLIDVTPSMHKVRRASLEAMVTSLISGAHCSVSSLEKSIGSDSDQSPRNSQ